MVSKPRRHAKPTLADERSFVALARLFHAFRKDKIPFLIIGMAAGVLQGVPVTTSDIDFWIGLPPNEHDKVLLACDKVGAKFLTDHIVELKDGSLLNFTYHVAGLDSFEKEIERAKQVRWLANKVPILSLERLIKSKEAVGRAKDKAHLVYLRQMLKLKKKTS